MHSVDAGAADDVQEDICRGFYIEMSGSREVIQLSTPPPDGFERHTDLSDAAEVTRLASSAMPQLGAR
jgi:hypothetical protein